MVNVKDVKLGKAERKSFAKIEEVIDRYSRTFRE